jgi:hypothetical protein
MGIELLVCRAHWTSLLCEIGISERPVYQMDASREQALGYQHTLGISDGAGIESSPESESKNG